MSEKPVSEMSFEEAMQELEALVNQLDGSQVELEKSIALYERGAALKQHCEDKLKAAEEKVAKLTFKSDGTPSSTEPLED